SAMMHAPARTAPVRILVYYVAAPGPALRLPAFLGLTLRRPRPALQRARNCRSTVLRGGGRILCCTAASGWPALALPPVVARAAAQSLRLALVRYRLDAGGGHLSAHRAGRGARDGPNDSRPPAAQGVDRVNPDGGQLRHARRRAPRGARAGAAPVRSDAAAAL